jgi:6-phosphogluconolactonase
MPSTTTSALSLQSRNHVASAPSIHRFRDLEALSNAVADEVLDLLGAAVQARGRATIALSGGKTPEGLFRAVAARGPNALPWTRIDLWWCDERAVPPSQPDSNYRMAYEALIEPLGLPAAQIHRVKCEHGEAESVARAYEAELVDSLGVPPAIDLVLLGLGADGHTASLFPGQRSFAETSRWVASTVAPASTPGPRAARITLTPRALNAARHVRFVVAGSDKAAAVAAALQGARDPLGRPAQRIVPSDGEVGWRIDDAAATLIEGLP